MRRNVRQIIADNATLELYLKKVCQLGKRAFFRIALGRLYVQVLLLSDVSLHDSQNCMNKSYCFRIEMKCILENIKQLKRLLQISLSNEISIPL